VWKHSIFHVQFTGQMSYGALKSTFSNPLLFRVCRFSILDERNIAHLSESAEAPLAHTRHTTPSQFLFNISFSNSWLTDEHLLSNKLSAKECNLKWGIWYESCLEKHYSYSTTTNLFCMYFNKKDKALLKLWIWFQCNIKLLKMALHNSKVKVNVL